MHNYLINLLDIWLEKFNFPYQSKKHRREIKKYTISR